VIRYICIALISTSLLAYLPAQTRRKPVKSAAGKHESIPEIPPRYAELLSGASQALIVRTPTWNAVDGGLIRFEKKNGAWERVGDSIPVVVGKNGLAWDGAVDGQWAKAEPVKKEGDGRSPAGVFALTQAFGYEPSAPALRLPYLPLTEGTECIDDASSSVYSHIVNREQTPHPDWNSSERMRTIPVYKLGLVVGYNSDALPGAGSCIFMHIWNGSGNGTAGCTAFEEASLKEIVNWLSADQHPVLIQMPEPTYRSLGKAWQLPEIH
jgi:D-alanyl-D-alanine dipeptidase